LEVHAQREEEAKMMDAQRDVDDPFEQVSVNELQQTALIDADPDMPKGK
jgi:hypothetical protein